MKDNHYEINLDTEAVAIMRCITMPVLVIAIRNIGSREDLDKLEDQFRFFKITTKSFTQTDGKFELLISFIPDPEKLKIQ